MTDLTTTHAVDDLSCEYIEAHGFAERYLLGKLSEPERDAYERHYLDCERCFHELTTVGALRTELNGPATPAISPTRAPQPNWLPVWLGAAAVIVLGVGLWTMGLGREIGTAPATGVSDPAVGPPAPVAAAPATTATAPVETPVSLATLARFEPPPYEAPVLRGTENEARKLFQAAMTHYLAGAHAKAVDGLRLATARDPRASDAGFFLGVCFLLTKQPQPGITELRRTIALGDSPYLEEAHFYLAKGLLQVGDVNAARRELRTMIALAGDHEREAKQLLAQVDRLRKER